MSIKFNEFENSKTICYLQIFFFISVDFQLSLRVFFFSAASVFLAAKSTPRDFSAATAGR